MSQGERSHPGRPVVLDELTEGLRARIEAEMRRKNLALHDVRQLMDWGPSRRDQFSCFLRGEYSGFGYRAAIAVATKLRIRITWNFSNDQVAA